GPDASGAVLGEGLAWFSPDAPATVTYYQRDRLLAGNHIPGPAIIFQLDTTTVIEPGWHAAVDQWGNLLVSRCNVSLSTRLFCSSRFSPRRRPRSLRRLRRISPLSSTRQNSCPRRRAMCMSAARIRLT